MGITVEGLRYSYDRHAVLKGVDFSFEEGNVVCVLGRNGAGKSTMFRCILGLLRGYEGNILINGRDIREMSNREMARQAAYIPQTHGSVYSCPVRDMVLLGTTASLGRFESPGRAQKEAAEAALRQVGIEYLADRSYGEISGGEQQMVLIARALAQQTKILIMDEPCANLDYGNQIRLLESLKRLAQEGYLVIQSIHNPEHAFLFADQALALLDGRAAGIGSPQKILTEELLAEMYHIDMELYSVSGSSVKVCIPKSIYQTGDDFRL